MKKNILKVAFATAFVAVAGYGVYASQKTDVMSDLILSNAEALARTESPSGYATVEKNTIEVWDEETNTNKAIVTIVCDGIGSLDCA